MIGVGTRDRGDDAAGWMVVERLQGIVDAERSTGDPARLVDRWTDADDVVLVDATRCGRTPGSVSVVDLLEQRLPVGTVHSSHGLGPLEAVDLGRALGTLPTRLTLVGIEGRSWDAMAPVTPSVERAVGRVVDMIVEWAAGSAAEPEVPGVDVRREGR